MIRSRGQTVQLFVHVFLLLSYAAISTQAKLDPLALRVLTS